MHRTIKNTAGGEWKAGVLALSGLALAGLLTGCGMGTSSNAGSSSTSIPGVALQGKVFGGQQPVSGSTIQLYAAGSTGYGSAANGLILPSSVTTNSGGGFSITGDYTCPSASSQVYIVATGGNPGSGTNTNLALMAALGSCGNLLSSTFISINELTTVASVYALAPFMTGISNVGTSTSSAAGLVYAFADVNTLTNTGTGTVPGTGLPSGATAPVSELNTLADILASCVNTVGGAASDTTDGYTNGTSCGKLFYLTTPSGGAPPTDTITATLNLAKAPGVNVRKLYLLQSSTPPFQPTLATAPNDFTIAVNYTGGTMSAPSALASDAAGNIWITNATGNTVTELAHSGAVLSGTGYVASLSTPSAIAIAADGTVWVTNQGNNSVSRLTAAGANYTGAPYSGGGLSQPRSIAFDYAGTAWIANAGNASITAITNTGTSTGYTPVAVTAPLAIAVDPH